MLSGWRRSLATRSKLRRSLRDLKALRLGDLRRVHLPDLKSLHLPDLKELHLPHLQAPEIDWSQGRMRSRAAALWPAVLAAAGAGVAVWSWNQWARSRVGAQAEEARESGLAPTRAPSEADRAGGLAGAASPAAIMAHAPSPDDPGGPDSGIGEVLPNHVRAALDESLAVQASATPGAAGRQGA